MEFQCPDTDWNVIDVAPAYSQLAGVLAGFVFTGIILLLTQRTLTALHIRTLTLFMAAFFLLALNSYQWGLMAGDSASVKACNRMWTEGQIASGLLGLGAVAIISGINWLLAAHLQAHPATSDEAARGRPLELLETLCRTALYSMAAIVALLLAVTSRDYLRIVVTDGSLDWLQVAVMTYPLLILVAIVALRVLRQRIGSPATDGTTLAIKLATMGAVLYTTVSTVFLGSIIGISGDFWVDIPLWMVMLALTAGLFAPAPSLVALVYAAPGFKAERR